MDKQRILYVVVLYGCKLKEAISYKTLLQDSSICNHDIFVYDNSPYIQENEIGVGKYIHDTNNGGLAIAYNKACNYAKENNYHWMMLLDQDTAFPNNAIMAYKKAIVSNPDIQMIVPKHITENNLYMSPTTYKMHVSHLQKKTISGIVEFSKLAPINSGILITVQSFLKVGGYDEKIWLDFSDVAFIEKYQKSYPKYYVLPEITCKQKFSALETSPGKIYNRFCIYLECAHNFWKSKPSIFPSLTLTTLRPTLSRTIKEGTLRYIKAYWKYYIKNEETRNGYKK